jgi:cyclopropane-fatty-acyl-phospholipid synthase
MLPLRSDFSVVENEQIPLGALRIKFREQIRRLDARLQPATEVDAVNREIEWVRSSRRGPITSSSPSQINDECYEHDVTWWKSFLGPSLKYSASLFFTDSDSLADAELATLEDYVRKAELQDGQDVLDIG